PSGPMPARTNQTTSGWLPFQAGSQPTITSALTPLWPTGLRWTSSSAMSMGTRPRSHRVLSSLDPPVGVEVRPVPPDAPDDAEGLAHAVAEGVHLALAGGSFAGVVGGDDRVVLDADDRHPIGR